MPHRPEISELIMTAIEIPQDLTAITPVGMTAQAGLAGAVIARLAEQQRGLPGWQAFHYELINPQQFEVTGGMLDPSQSGMRKFSGPHETVVIAASEVLSALQAALLAEAADAAGPAQTASPSPQTIQQGSPQQGLTLAKSATTQAYPYPYLNLTLALPEDAAARAALLARLATGMTIEGATVLASALLPDYPAR